jgi:hypothetical protein
MNLETQKSNDMAKKTRTKILNKRFNEEDVNNWQEQANLSAGGNLTLWMELTLNAACLSAKKPKKAT